MTQLSASTLIKLHETKNFNILNDVFQILCGDKTVDIPKLPQEEVREKNILIKKEVLTPNKKCYTPKKELFTPKKELFSPKKEIFSPIPDPVKDESVSEIEGTPTGRTSPIIQSRKLRNSSAANSSDLRDKKKCPDNW